MAEPIHLELLADFFNRIGQQETNGTATKFRSVCANYTKFQQCRLVGTEALERLALNARNNRNEPPQMAHHPNKGDDGAVLIGDLLASKGCDVGRSVGLLESAKDASSSPLAP
jgi:hypothetical protein